MKIIIIFGLLIGMLMLIGCVTGPESFDDFKEKPWREKGPCRYDTIALEIEKDSVKLLEIEGKDVTNTEFYDETSDYGVFVTAPHDFVRFKLLGQRTEDIYLPCCLWVKVYCENRNCGISCLNVKVESSKYTKSFYLS